MDWIWLFCNLCRKCVSSQFCLTMWNVRAIYCSFQLFIVSIEVTVEKWKSPTQLKCQCIHWNEMRCIQIAQSQQIILTNLCTSLLLFVIGESAIWFNAPRWLSSTHTQNEKKKDPKIKHTKQNRNHNRIWHAPTKSISRFNSCLMQSKSNVNTTHNCSLIISNNGFM